MLENGSPIFVMKIPFTLLQIILKKSGNISKFGNAAQRLGFYLWAISAVGTSTTACPRARPVWTAWARPCCRRGTASRPWSWRTTARLTTTRPPGGRRNADLGTVRAPRTAETRRKFRAFRRLKKKSQITIVNN